MNVNIQIDGKPFSVPEGLSVRKAALKNGIYIPGLCGHPDLPVASKTRLAKQVYRGDSVIASEFSDTIAGEAGNCNLCLVKVNGFDKLQRACETEVSEGLSINTQGEEISQARKSVLAKILAHHPHSCLTCAQREGCSLTQCSSNVPEDERCCILLNRCELGKIVDYIGLPDSTPKYTFENFPRISGDPFFDREYNLCIGCLRCVRMCADVRGVEALAANIHNDRIWVGTSNPGLLTESDCRFCGACVEVCPTGALRDKPDSKPVHHGENPPCVDACPAGIDIPAYVKRIAEGDFAGALEVIYRSVPFPGILGYVCFHPCESACKRETLDESISICALKRYAYENAPETPVLNLEKSVPTGKNIAVAGSGPAGLTAAFYLQKAGHQVDVFEAAEKPGGMLRYAIPEYRLPEEVLEDELKPFHDLGVNIKTGVNIGVDLSVEQLRKDYDAVLVTIGAGRSKDLDLPGRNLAGVTTALELLRSLRTGKIARMTGKTVVVGGGNVAIDSAMTALRLGAQAAAMVCLEQRDEMPAHTWELKQAAEEGVKV
ncbi:MAG: FAD-dependent oxidoreductase, partial [FCB group bacterium]|nr:FAD-dependent oxidoreductase [FCB group bacterium]